MALDSYANHTFRCNPELFVEIHKQQFSVKGVNGKGPGTEISRLPCFGNAAITPRSDCNAILLHDAEQHRVEYYQRDRWVVHVASDLILNFIYDEEQKAYFCIFTDKILKRVDE